MATTSKTGFNALIVSAYINSGIPVRQAARAHPTFSLLMGKPQEEVMNNLGKPVPVVNFKGLQKLDERNRTLKFAVRKGSAHTSQLARTDAGSNRTGFLADIGDVYEVTTAYAFCPKNISKFDIDEGDKGFWEAQGSREQWLGAQIAEDYVNQMAPLLFGTGATGVPGDGKLGSLRYYISDGLNATQRAIVGTTDESAYASYFGIDRVDNLNKPVRANYVDGGGVAFTEAQGQNAALRCFANGATNLVAPMSLRRFAAFTSRIRSQYGKMELTSSDPLFYALGDTGAIKADGVTYYADPDVPDNTTWQLIMDVASIKAGSNYRSVKSEMHRQTGTNAMWSLDTYFKHQVVVDAPNRCCLIENLQVPS